MEKGKQDNGNASRGSESTTTPESGFDGEIDSATIQVDATGRTVLIARGWLLNRPIPIALIQCGLPGLPLALAEPQRRDDLAKQIPDLPGIEKAGFECTIALPPGIREVTGIVFLANLADGRALSGVMPCSVKVASPAPAAAPKSTPAQSPPAPAAPTGKAGAPAPNSPAALFLETKSFIERYRRRLTYALESFLESAGTINFTPCENPQISIVMALHNQASYTLACLQSLLAVRGVSIEVIVVDNGSTDETGRLLSRVSGAQIIRNRHNEHFIAGSNAGAAVARGEYLLFLNNDTELLPGSLETAADVLRRDETVGAVGARLMFPDGTLQEAGCILWRDGRVAACGTLEDSDDFHYRYTREVDYCSAAFLLTRTKLFRSIGGFDTAYSPAYYEDVDYCVALWQRGHRVLYEPRVAVIHARFGSSTHGAAKDLIEKNRPVFQQRRRDYLIDRCDVERDSLLIARDLRRVPRLLFIDEQIPMSSKGSGYPRTLELIKTLDGFGYAVTFLPAVRAKDGWHDIYREIPHTVEVARNVGMEGLADFLQLRPGYFDEVLVSRVNLMKRFTEITEKLAPHLVPARVVYDSEALVAERRITAQTSLYKATFTEEERARLVREELEVSRGAHEVVAVSSADRQRFEAWGAPRVHLIGHSAAANPTSAGFRERRGLVFLGLLGDRAAPNYVGLRWFIDEVLPLVSRKWPAKERRSDPHAPILQVFGRNQVEELDILARESGLFEMAGEADDLYAMMNSARVFVAPLRWAAGISLKSITAAAYGVPIVTTPAVAGVMGWTHREQALIAETPRELAAACLQLNRDAGLWQTLRENALAWVAREYSPERFRDQISRIFPPVRPASDKLDAEVVLRSVLGAARGNPELVRTLAAALEGAQSEHPRTTSNKRRRSRHSRPSNT